MKIAIDSLETPYNFLRSIETKSISSGGDFEEGLVDEDRKTNMILFRYSPVILPEPLDDINIIFKRFGDNYSAVVPIDSLDSSIFGNVGKRLSKKFMETGYEFVIARQEPELVGALYGSEGKCDFDIAASPNGSMRIIGMGTHGSYTKKLENFEVFIEDIENLEGIVNLFLGCLLDPLREGRDDLKFLNGKIRYLNP